MVKHEKRERLTQRAQRTQSSQRRERRRRIHGTKNVRCKTVPRCADSDRHDEAWRRRPGVEVVPRSLRCATAEGAVAPVGMTGWRKARRAKKRRGRKSRVPPCGIGMTIVRRTGKVVRGVKLAARLRRRALQGQERPKSEEK